MALLPDDSFPADRPVPAAEHANEAIRALVDASGQDWSEVESATYEVLLIEWAAATRGGPDIIEAA
ncbi:hypothetical protein ACIQUZ_10220 [Streptomyces griseus]|nr:MULTISPECIES: hypothetical protein [Streptomyces]KUJ64808.1 hypothetical protein ACZ90_55795 [Streptomyces albus subsp. albus]MYR10332.1 hypothetical protein [Streptomyces sp. SID724]MYR49003.1 hypothetical protein [Streptomyces sp. SID4928]MYT79480.1 hypothetical protein [Streptomyces sp. SID8364]EGE40941.1 hypothetical protein SACT1_1576 [Streptomyces sp. ACT-1]